MSIGTNPGDRASLGREGERAAASAYLKRGFSVVARNWRCPAGELDLIVSRGPLVVFCEVKTRSGSAFGGGYEAVTAKKQRKLRQLAELFMVTTGIRPRATRFDVASVRIGPGTRPWVELFEDAF
jgi:putative endonuclease